jgi:hypothetical protein
MTTLSTLSAAPDNPASTSWYLADLGEFRGKQELYTRQSPQRLKTLREHALIESAVSSNRIKGVTVTSDWVRNVLVVPRPIFRDRDEEEIRGYRDALKWIHEHHTDIPVSEETISQLAKKGNYPLKLVIKDVMRRQVLLCSSPVYVARNIYCAPIKVARY